MVASYEKEESEILTSLPKLKGEIEKLKSQSAASDRFLNVINKYTFINELSAEILNELIEKIVVHHKEKSGDGRTFQQIEIYYRFVGKIDADAQKAA